MREIVGVSLSRFHDSVDQFEFLIAYADGREIGHEVSRRAAQAIQRELNGNLDLNTPPPSSHVAVPQDVINLVIAAREFWDDKNDLSDEAKALDLALEAFSSRVPYENEPENDR